MKNKLINKKINKKNKQQCGAQARGYPHTEELAGVS